MLIAAALTAFKEAVAQCDSLIVNVHRVGSDGRPFLPAIDRQQITVAAFLNMFIAWEAFLEATLSSLLSGAATISGNPVSKFASPPDALRAQKMLIGTQRYFDYGNHQSVIKIVQIYFENGAPFRPHIDSIYGYLDDLRTMRNSSAHLSSTTQAGLEALALRLLGRPSQGITLYSLLTANNPHTQLGATILETYKDHLLATAELIANG